MDRRGEASPPLPAALEVALTAAWSVTDMNTWYADDEDEDRGGVDSGESTVLDEELKDDSF